MEMTNQENEQKQILRFSRFNRILHIGMILSFMSLALTGMTLKFSYTSWAVFLSRMFGGFEFAGFIHRVAATIMFIIFFSHIFDLLKRKKREYGSMKNLLFGPNTMLPTKKDLRDFVDSIKWFLWLGPRPKYGKWTYWEKFDYFAVFWGMMVIGSTGLVLWFPEFFTKFIPGEFINVATIIHSDEALLATGFIFTVHFFNTHLRPEKFPMDICIFTGRVPLEEYKMDRPDDYQKLIESGELEKYLVEPYPEVVIRGIKIFGWIALSIGFFMVVWIIYAMIFAYK
ncbi:MAG: putative cytochrome C [Ignavibacteriae bacterium]|nr:MAG: putative cytochrome C [Ignavibacteriota bacterium]